jgi:uroporphyrinogen decarboxylase
MTPRDRVLTSMRRTGKPDRVPFEISWGAFTPGLMEVYRQRTGSTLDPAEYFDFDTRLVNLDPTRKRTDFSPWFKQAPPPSTVWDEWGYGALRGSIEHFLEYRYHPLAACTSPEQIIEFNWPDVDADYRFDGVERSTRSYQERGYAVAGELYLTIFETSWLLRGMETLLLDLFNNQDIAHAIFESIADIRVRQAVKYAQIGVDVLRLGDDVATQKGPIMSLELYQQFLKPRMGRIIAAAKKVKPDILIFMHSDGAMVDFIPDYIDIGVDIVNPIQPECNDLAEIGRKFGGKISFWGGIGTQTTMPYGTPEEVKNKVQEVQTQLGCQGGLLLAPSHILEPEVPWENVIAFVEAAREAKYE